MFLIHLLHFAVLLTLASSESNSVNARLSWLSHFLLLWIRDLILTPSPTRLKALLDTYTFKHETKNFPFLTMLPIQLALIPIFCFMFVPVFGVRVCVSALLGQCHMCMCNWLDFLCFFPFNCFMTIVSMDCVLYMCRISSLC